VTSLIVTLAIAGLVYVIQSRDAMEAAHKAQPRTLAVTPGYPVHLAMGSNTYVIEGPNPKTLSGVSGIDLGWNFMFRVDEQGTLYLDIEIRDDDDRVVTFIDDSRLVLQPGIPEYDINSDTNAVEVVDAQREPVLQVIRDPNKRSFQINARMVRRRGNTVQAAVCNADTCYAGSGDDARKFTLGLPIFEYPGYTHPGKRRSVDRAPTSTTSPR